MTAREQQTTAERLRRWRLILGGGAADGIGVSGLSDPRFSYGRSLRSLIWQ
jgi:hypothetical protein